MGTVPLERLARTIRSKNAGNFRLTLDVIFSDRETYRRVKASGAITAEKVAAAYGIDPSQITDFIEYDAGLAYKITLYRPVPSGNPGDADVYGCQQFIPLLKLPVPWEEEEPPAGYM